jgi:CheY-like chemotaxis protein
VDSYHQDLFVGKERTKRHLIAALALIQIMEATTQQPPVPRPLVLVIDDEQSVRQHIRIVLEHFFGAKAIETDSSKEALELAVQHDFDLVTSDLTRPHMDGFKFLAAFERIKPRVPVIIISAVSGFENRARALGAFGCLNKPFNAEELNLIASEAFGARKAGYPWNQAEVPVLDGAMSKLNELMQNLKSRIKGSISLVRASDTNRVLLLIDESVVNPAVVMENSVNAAYFIEEVGSALVGLEGFPGGNVFDTTSRTYSEKRHSSQFNSQDLIFTIFAKDRVFDGDTLFAWDMVHQAKVQTVGVDSPELFREIKETAHSTEETAQHPNQLLRSRHMLKSLLWEAAQLDWPPCIMLNAGSRHISDIENAINGEFADLALRNYTVLRLRSTSFSITQPPLRVRPGLPLP